MDDGFITVEKKFRYKSVNPRKGKRKGRYQFKDPSDYDLQDLLLILSQRKETLLESSFYKQLLDIYHRYLVPTRPVDMVCYGIGSMRDSKNAQYQFVLALLMRELLNIPGKVYIYDPVMTDLDRELCIHHDIQIIQENEDGKRAVSRPTLFYMPHCSRGLYSNTLSANWNKDAIQNVVIIGNRFDMYVGSQLQRDLKEECPYLIPAMEIVQRVLFPKEFDNNQVFNDLSIQWFPRDRVLEMDPDFWRGPFLPNETQ